MVGTSALILLFALFAWRGYRVAAHARDAYGFLLAFGFTSLVVWTVAINMAVVTGLLPATGIPLPFISYGGSNLLFNMIGVGVILSVSRG